MDRILEIGQPMWQVMYLSPTILLTLLIHLVLDGGVVCSCLKIFKIKMRKDVLVRTMVMTWVLGFVSDVVPIFGVLVLKVFISIDSIPEVIINLVLVVFSFTGMFFLSKYLFKRVAISFPKTHKMALIVSLITSPWLYLMPTSSMY